MALLDYVRSAATTPSFKPKIQGGLKLVALGKKPFAAIHQIGA